MNKNLIEIKDSALWLQNLAVQSRTGIENYRNDGSIIFGRPNFIGNTSPNQIINTAINNVFSS